MLTTVDGQGSTGDEVRFVSDEEDQSPYGVNDYTNAFRGIKDSRDMFNASALVVTDRSACTGPDLNGGGGVEGTRYIDVAQNNGGILGNISNNIQSSLFRYYGNSIAKPTSGISGRQTMEGSIYLMYGYGLLPRKEKLGANPTRVRTIAQYDHCR